MTTIAPFTGQILYINLTTGACSTLPTLPYGISYLGGRGLAARLAWDLIPPGVGAFDAENPLMFFPGALVGTPAPSSGRTVVAGLSPQAYPHEWYTRANFGGHWGPELKYAGYDGLVITGKAARPVYLCIEDGRVELRDAKHLWGLGLIETQRRLQQELGEGARVVAIGPAGENLCRYAVVATNTESAAGQGGFGAVMGSKNLKAIAVRGHGGVGVADPVEMLRRSRLVVEAVFKRYPKSAAQKGEGAGTVKRRPSPCTYQCPRACGDFYQEAPGVIHKERTYSGHIFCCAPLFGGEWLGIKFGQQIAFELGQIANDLGINHWEPLFGIVPWILLCQKRGELTHIGGQALDFSTPGFWVEFLNNVAYRRGWGDILAEGGPRAAEKLGIGQDLIGEYYPAWGQSSHWDGHGSFRSPYFPYWLVTALQWAMDTRDPIGGGHGYTTNIFGLLRSIKPDDHAALDKFRAVGAHLYGDANAVDPWSGYAAKAIPATFHQDRGALKDSLGICDNIFPLLTDPNEPDFLIRVEGVEGRYLEHYLFEPACEASLSREEFYRIGTRIYTLERLLAIRNWGRSRVTDETIIPYLERPEGSVSPYLGEKVTLDAQRFRELLKECYALRGWDVATGRPTPESLRALGLDALLQPESTSVPKGE